MIIVALLIGLFKTVKKYSKKSEPGLVG